MRKHISILIVLVLLVVSLVGCAAKASDNYAKGDVEYLPESNEGTNADGDLLENNLITENRKIIEKHHIDVQTKEFDALVSKMESEIQALSGYVQNSSVSGSDLAVNRFASYTIRIPSDKSKDFTAFVSDNSTITRKSIETEDVTLNYVDTESRISALETEKKSLEELLSKADTLTDVIAIQDRLTDVIYEIETNKSQLRTYDSLIDYTTFYVNISEVERVVVVEEQTMWQEIGTNLKNNFEDIGYGFRQFFIGLISGLPYILLVGILFILPPVIVAVAVVKKVKKNKGKK